MIFSDQQLAFFEELRNSTSSLVLEAVAGSGKTTTIVEGARSCVPKEKATLFLAFNKKIVEELERRLPPNVMCGTFHSVCLKALSRSLPRRPKIEAKKTYDLLKQNLSWKDQQLYSAFAARLVSYAKSAGIGIPSLEPDEQRSWDSLVAHFSLTCDSADADPQRGIEIAQNCFRESISLLDLIDFDDMLYLALAQRVKFDVSNFIFVDEAQDTNSVQRELLKLMGRFDGSGVSRLIAVGDPMQCQPSYTLVSIIGQVGNRWHKAKTKQLPINEVKVGDKVISYSLRDHSFIMTGREVLAVEQRQYSGELVVVKTASGLKSSYTPEHRCLVNFSSLRDYYALYIMRKGSYFRVGKCKMDYGDIGSGPIARLRQEQGDSIWILDVYPTDEEAKRTEEIVTGQFGLPQLLFTSTNASVMSQEMLDSTWQSIGANGNKAIQALEFYRRDISHPLHNRLTTDYCSLKRPLIVEACNLLQGCLILPFSGDAHTTKQTWHEAWIDYEFYEGLVYSLKVDIDELYIADGLVTHNSIYGFRGTDSDALELIKSDFNAKTMPLSTCYRCSQSVIAEVHRHFPDLKPCLN